MIAPSDWSHGYPVDGPYPAAWHHFQSPAHLRAVCALMGVAWDVGTDTPLTIAEIGCGTGYTAAILAAGSPNWHVLGIDYNPAHISEGRSMACAARLGNLQFLEADLAEIGDFDLDRLPEFDLITVHGVWSWVSDTVRDGILRLLRRRLKPGGLALITYNALPGAAGALGLARLVREAIRRADDPVEGLGVARKLVERLIAAEANHLPRSSWRSLITGDIPGARQGYLLHEFLTEHWCPSFFADVAASLASARCDFVGSATIDENVPYLTLSPAQRELWDEAPSLASRQLILDTCVPRAFRRDLFVRGLRRVPRDPAIDALWFAEATRAQAEITVKTQAGEAALPLHLITPIRKALAERPRTIGALRALPGCETVTPSELLAVLAGTGCAVPLWRAPGHGQDWEMAAAAARRLNAVAADRLAPYGVGQGQLGLATPALGGALPVAPLELAVARLAAEHPACDASALMRLLLPPGPSPEADVITELERRIGALLDERRPIWKALGIL